jgi:hypothetical protein
MTIIADLPGAYYSFLPSVALTEERPDIVVWDSIKVHLVELTVSFETGLEEASQHKQIKYADLTATCKRKGFTTTIIIYSPGWLKWLPPPA